VIKALHDKMEKEQLWPNVWSVEDGSISRVNFYNELSKVASTKEAITVKVPTTNEYAGFTIKPHVVPDNLFTDGGNYDKVASAKKYAELVRQALTVAYPGADIEVLIKNYSGRTGLPEVSNPYLLTIGKS
jgi:hypothetical protein